MRLETTTVAPPARRRVHLLGALLALALPWAAQAQPAAPAAAPAAVDPVAFVARPTLFTAPPKIDGHLDDPVWQTAAKLDNFHQLEPNEGQPATEATEVYLGYDADNLYIGARCHDSEPAKIVTTTLTHDSEMTYDDTIQILLDTYRDGRSAFLFTTNSGGVQVDALVRNEGELINLDWDGIWTVQGSRDAGGWSTEIAIPWRTLRFPDRPAQEWGFVIERLVARKQERTYWKAPPKTWYARWKLNDAPTLVGLEGARPGSRFHFAPYAILGAERPQNGGHTSSITHLGGDIKINLASDLVADITIKTDFSETEADAQDVNLTRNALLFPEKRPFFLEGANVFYAGQRQDPEHASEYFLFFSRQIGIGQSGQTIPILGGVKLTGHEGKYDIGALSIATEATRKLDPYGRLIDEPRTTWSVGRVKRDLGNGSTLGLIGLSKDGTGRQNRVGGADWDITLNKNLRTGGWLAKSSTPGVESDDWAGSADVYWDSRRFRFHEEYTQTGKGFNDELGYIARTGVNAFRSDNFYIIWPERGPFKLVWWTADLDYITDRFTGELQTKFWHLQYNSYFKNSSGFAYKYFVEEEVLAQPLQIVHGLFIPPGTYKFDHQFFGFQTDYTKPLGGAGRVAWGDYYDGHFLQTFYYAAYRPIPGLFIAGTYQHTHVVLKEGRFNSDIALGEITHAFSNRLSVRSWLQWARGSSLRTKFDVDWEFRPGSRFFLVYQDIRTYIDFFDPRQPLFGTPGRQLIAKTVFAF